jgi:acyl-CoA synthetase (AMP-forming)/AMP-acid ligase II
MHITDLYFRGVRTHPNRLALTGDGGDYTYLEAWRTTHRIARRLNESGFGSGQRFAVLSPNSTRAFVAMLGGMRSRLCPTFFISLRPAVVMCFFSMPRLPA